MERRNFIRNTVAGSLAFSGISGIASAATPDSTVSNSAKFKLNYAPGLGTFREHAGEDPIENLKFIADQGFTAFFDNGLMWKPAEMQEKIGNEAARLGLDIGPFIVYADHGAKYGVTDDPEVTKMLVGKTQEALDVQKRTGAKTGLITFGIYDEKMDWDYQTINVINNMRACCDVAGKSGIGFGYGTTKPPGRPSKIIPHKNGAGQNDLRSC